MNRTKNFNYRAQTVQGKNFIFETVVQPLVYLTTDARPLASFNPAVIFNPNFAADDISNAPAGLIATNTEKFHLLLPLRNAPIIPFSYSIQIYNSTTLAPFLWNYFFPYQWRNASRQIRYDRTARQMRRMDAISNPTQMFQSLDNHYLYDEDFFIPDAWDNIITMPGNYNQAGYFLPTDLVTNLNANSLALAPLAAGNDWTVTKIFNYFAIEE